MSMGHPSTSPSRNCCRVHGMNEDGMMGNAGLWGMHDDGECLFEWDSGLFDSFLVEETPAAAPTQPTWEERQSVPVDDVMAELFGEPAAKRSRSGALRGVWGG